MCHTDSSSSYICLGSMTICFVSLVFMAYSLNGGGPMWLFMAAAFTAILGLFVGYFFAVLKEIRLAEEKYYCVDNNLNE